MISPISAVSGYSVQAIYGNPVSVNRVKPVSEDTTANRPMMTVAKNDEIDVPSNISKENASEVSTKPEATSSVATGGNAEIVKQLEQLKSAISKDPLEDADSEDKASALASTSMAQNPFANQFSNYSQDLLQMGYQQNIRDKVSSSEAQSNVAETTQKASDYFAKTPALEEIKNMLENPTISQSVEKMSESSEEETKAVAEMVGANS